MSIPTLRYKRGALAAATLCSLLALSACGGSSAPRPELPPPAGSTPPPVSAGDSFFAYVAARIGSLLDNEEPAAIDAVTETKPENTEPEPVG